ncbi:hypothetical protein GRJ2_000591300 [Grus japonensis]|uniref:Uncharacterized protein n=1 Tax=Grus japonensis TaxID=30415 RepID=A0ABC9W842_GRUJA
MEPVGDNLSDQIQVSALGLPYSFFRPPSQTVDKPRKSEELSFAFGDTRYLSPDFPGIILPVALLVLKFPSHAYHGYPAPQCDP